MDTDRRTILKTTTAAGAALLAPGGALAAAGAGRMDDVRRAVAAGHDAAVARLRDWIALPSIAAEGRNYPQGADAMAKLARDAGFQHAEVVPSPGKPGVFATLDAGAKRTLGVYFMYDVKQFDPAEWDSPPLEGRLVDKPGFGKVVVGRGAVNQKGPETAFLAALYALRAAGRQPPVNLVLVAEGEEEIASPNFHAIVTTPRVRAALETCVGVIIPSADQELSGGVTMTLGAKGAVEFELVSSSEAWGRGAARDIHSSLKAMLDSPVWHLVEALASCVSPDGNTVTIDGIQDLVRPLTPRQQELVRLNARANSEADWKRQNGVERFIDDLPWEEAQLRLAAAPTLNIQGLSAGYEGPGGKTILPHRAIAKCEFRLVPDMTREDTVAKLRAHLAKRGFGDIAVNVTGGYGPTQTAEDSALVRAMLATLARQDVPVTLTPRSAGSWPGVVFTGPPLNLPAMSFGTGYGDGAHAPNEFYVVESSNPRIMGLDGATLGFVELLYQVAAMG